MDLQGRIYGSTKTRSPVLAAFVTGSSEKTHAPKSRNPNPKTQTVDRWSKVLGFGTWAGEEMTRVSEAGHQNRQKTPAVMFVWLVTPPLEKVRKPLIAGPLRVEAANGPNAMAGVGGKV